MTGVVGSMAGCCLLLAASLANTQDLTGTWRCKLYEPAERAGMQMISVDNITDAQWISNARMIMEAGATRYDYDVSAVTNYRVSDGRMTLSVASASVSRFEVNGADALDSDAARKVVDDILAMQGWEFAYEFEGPDQFRVFLGTAQEICVRDSAEGPNS